MFCVIFFISELIWITSCNINFSIERNFGWIFPRLFNLYRLLQLAFKIKFRWVFGRGRWSKYRGTSQWIGSRRDTSPHSAQCNRVLWPETVLRQTLCSRYAWDPIARSDRCLAAKECKIRVPGNDERSTGWWETFEYKFRGLTFYSFTLFFTNVRKSTFHF